MLKNQRGFTIIEIISIIVILGIVGAIALPRITPDTIDINSAAQIVRSDLRFLQRLAMGQNTNTMSIAFNNNASTYTVFDPAGNPDIRTLPDGVTFVGNKTISYNRFGEPTFVGANDTVQLTNNFGQNMTLTIEQYTGLITLAGP